MYKRQAKEGRYFRRVTAQGRELFDHKSGPVWEAFVQWYVDRPQFWPTQKVEKPVLDEAGVPVLDEKGKPMVEEVEEPIDLENPETLERFLEGQEQLDRMTLPKDTKLDKSLTHVRALKAMPSYLMVGGKEVQILNVDAHSTYTEALDSQGRTIGLYNALAAYLEHEEPWKASKDLVLDSPDGSVLGVNFDELVKRWRKHVVNGAIKKGYDPGRAQATFDRSLDNYVRAYGQDLVGEVFLMNPQGLLPSVATIAQRNLSASMLSMAFLYDPFQPMNAASRVGLKNLMKAYGDIVFNKGGSRSERMMAYGILDAIPRAYLDLKVHKDRPTFDLLSRVVPSAIIAPGMKSELYFQAVSARAWEYWARSLETGKPFSNRDRSILSHDLRLNPQELGQLETGEMTEAIKNKIIRNGVKTTNFLAEDAFRRGTVTNNPFWRMVLPFFSYAAGLGRANARGMRRGREAFRGGWEWQKSGFDNEKFGAERDELLKFVYATSMMFVAYLGQGLFQKYMRRFATGDKVFDRPDDPDPRGSFMEKGMFVVDGFKEAGMFGFTSHFADACKFSNGNHYKAAINHVTYAAVTWEMLAKLTGLGQHEGAPLGTRVRDLALDGAPSPVVRGIRRWYEKAVYPERVEFKGIRREVIRYLKDRDKDTHPS